MTEGTPHAPYIQMKHSKLFLLIPLALWLASCGVFHVEVQVINEAADQATGAPTILPSAFPTNFSALIPTIPPTTFPTNFPTLTPAIPPTTSSSDVHVHTAVFPITTTPPTKYQELGSSFSFDAALGDLDGDGDLDAFVANRYKPEGIWLNDGTGHFTDSGQVIGWDSYTFAVALGDVDGDGDLDAYLGNSVITEDEVWLNDGSGQFIDSGQRPFNRYTNDAALADLDQDGDLDAIIANLGDPYGNEGSVNIWLNNGHGQFTDSGQQLGELPCQAVALGDLDDDGDLDIFAVFTSKNPAIESAQPVWLNDGQGRFTNAPQGFTIRRLRAAALGDVDSDGDLDLLLGNEGDWNRIWLNDGRANFTNSGQELGIDRTSTVTLADMNQDGGLDALIGSEQEGNQLWLNDGHGRFQQIELGMGLGDYHTSAILVGDLDQNGAPDLFIANSGSSSHGEPCEVRINPQRPTSPYP